MSDDQITDPYQISRNANAAFAEKVAEFEQARQTAQPAPQPSQADLDWCNEMQSYKGADGKRLYEASSSFRQKLAAARATVFAGGSIDDVKAATARSIRGEPEPAAQPTQTPAEPQGKPAERLDAHLAEGGYVEPAEVTPEQWQQLTGGYKIDLPPGFGIGATEAEMLRSAKYAGVSEQQVKTIIARLIEAQGGAS